MAPAHGAPVVPASASQPPTEHTKLLSASAELERETQECIRTKHVGLVALFALIWSWVLQAEASQTLQSVVEFNKPFFIVCFNHSTTVLLLPFVFAYYKICGTPEDHQAKLDFVRVLQRHSEIPLGKLARTATFLATFYCVADYFWYATLANVSVAAGTAIFNCSPLFVYCFSICFLHERLSLKKVCGVFTAFVGVTLIVMFQDGSDVDSMANTSVIAGLLVVLSAALYGGYEVTLRVVVGEELTDTSTILTMTGLCGVFTLPFWALGSVALSLAPWPSVYESFGFPDGGEGVLMLLLSGAMAVIFSVFLPLSLCWTSPLETSVGCMLTIPLSGLMDTFVHGTSFSWECIVGSVLVMGGFGILEYTTSRDQPPHHHYAVEESKEVA